MKKLLYVLIVVAILIAGFTVASADSHRAAIVVNNDVCWLPDASGSFEFDDLWEIPKCATCLETTSEAYIKVCSFHGKLPKGAQLPKTPMLFTYENTGGFECFWTLEGGPYADQYQFIVTPSGQASGYCVWTEP